MSSRRTMLFAAIVTIAFFAFPVRSQDKKGGPGTQPDQAQMQAMMDAYSKPGPQHDQIARQFSGTWNAEVTMYMGPNPDKSTGTMKNEMMLGGRFLQNMFNGTSMGQPFQGAGVMGYDNARKMYFGTWMDTMGTGMMVSEGTYDEATKTYKMTGKMTGPDGKEVTAREVTRIVNDDKHTFEMYMPGEGGQEMKVLEITYTRKK